MLRETYGRSGSNQDGASTSGTFKRPLQEPPRKGLGNRGNCFWRPLGEPPRSDVNELPYTPQLSLSP